MRKSPRTEGRMGKRILLACLVVAVAGGYALLSAGKSTEEAACGLGPPPGSAAFAEFEARQAAEVERTGYLTVCESNLARYDVASELRPLAWALIGLDFKPVELAGTPFKSFANAGALAEDVDRVKSRLYRSFRMPDGHTVTLFEHDMSANGISSFRNPKDEPERVNGLPARLVVMQARTGKAVSLISWTEGRRYYELWMDANVSLDGTRPQLFALAASLPKSVPARLHEPELRSPTLGPDGMPQFPAPPAMIQIGK